MPRDSHRRAAELHNLAAHAHLAAATHHEKQDHESGHEASRKALEHSAQAFSESQEAHRKSTAYIGAPVTSKGSSDGS